MEFLWIPMEFLWIPMDSYRLYLSDVTCWFRQRVDATALCKPAQLNPLDISGFGQPLSQGSS
jgi:hypothetical protein